MYEIRNDSGLVLYQIASLPNGFTSPNGLSISGDLTQLTTQELNGLGIFFVENKIDQTPIIIPPTKNTESLTVDKKISKLWSAANSYQSSQISGAAIGLLTIGVLQGKQKSIAIQNWIKAIWLLYYTRKAGITDDIMPDFDFSSIGNIPYTIPELMEEVGI